MMPALKKLIGPGLTVAVGAPGAVSQGRKYTAQQRERRNPGSVPPGGIPPMKKVSARRALDHYLKKQAGPLPPTRGGLAHALPWALLAGAGLTAGGMGASAAARGVGGVYQRFQSNRMFEELQRRYPEIRRHPKAREYFDLIIAYAPSLMRHPAAIGDFLRRQLEYPMSSVEFIKQLADLEATVSKTESSGPASQFGHGAAQAGGGLLVPLAQSHDMVRS